jgi:aminoglycoside phosphotransferase (APT) family kinase protein
MINHIDQAAPTRSGEEIDIARLEEYLAEYLPPTKCPLIVEQFPSGFSNLTYLLKWGDDEFVLRRPPIGNVVKSAHDMGREYRVLSQLCEVYSPAPKPLLFCEDEKILGDKFYVMERLQGVILRQSNTPQELKKSPTLVANLCKSFIENLALLHKIDYQAAGLEDLGHPEGYAERQVTGWVKRYAKAKTDNYFEIEKLGSWLVENIPVDSAPALIHNDYKYDNLVLDPDDLTNILGVLDWEMATIGNPLMDLGTTLAYWVEPADPPEEQALAFGPTAIDGSFSRAQLVEHYAHNADTELPAMIFYYCFGLFKLAVIVQQIYARYAAGKTKDPRFANLNKRVELLGKTGVRVIDTGEI